VNQIGPAGDIEEAIIYTKFGYHLLDSFFRMTKNLAVLYTFG
jgi:hypothetical protein